MILYACSLLSAVWVSSTTNTDWSHAIYSAANSTAVMSSQNVYSGQLIKGATILYALCLHSTILRPCFSCSNICSTGLDKGCIEFEFVVFFLWGWDLQFIIDCMNNYYICRLPIANRKGTLCTMSKLYSLTNWSRERKISSCNTK